MRMRLIKIFNFDLPTLLLKIIMSLQLKTLLLQLHILSLIHVHITLLLVFKVKVILHQLILRLLT